MTTNVNEDNSDKAKAPDEFIYRSVSLVCFTAELDEKIDLQSMYMKLIINTGCIRACTQTIASVFSCFSPLLL